MHKLAFALVSASLATTVFAVDYKSQVVPILRIKCYECHSVAKGKTKGDLALDTDEKMKENMGPGGIIIPGEPAKSDLAVCIKLPNDDDSVMPPKGKNRLSDAEVAIIENWIKEGANLGSGPTPTAASAPAAASAGGGVQKWTSADGRTIEATFMGLQGDGVLLKIAATGVTHLVPLARLSAESQTQAKAAR